MLTKSNASNDTCLATNLTYNTVTLVLFVLLALTVTVILFHCYSSWYQCPTGTKTNQTITQLLILDTNSLSHITFYSFFLTLFFHFTPERLPKHFSLH